MKDFSKPDISEEEEHKYNLKFKMQNYNSKLKTDYDLKKRTYSYSIQIINFINKLSKDSTTQTIANQLLRSATSIGANIVEAQFL